MDANRFDALVRSATTRPSRRGIGRTVIGFVFAGTIGAAAIPDAAAKKCAPCRTKKNGKCKGKKPNGTRCEDGRGVCQGGRCRCGSGAACSTLEVCQAGVCFPTGTCPNNTQACVPEMGTVCGDDCFCATSAEGVTVCIESGGLCINFTNDNCTTGAECSLCQSSADCDPGQACIDISGCCDDFVDRTVPLPAGTKTCVDPCADPER